MHEGHRERIRQRIEQDGLDSLQPHELLEYLLFFTNKRKNTNEIGHRLINTFGGIDKVFDASESELCKVEGVGPISAQFLSLVPALCRCYLTAKQGRKQQFISLDRIVKQVTPEFFGANSEICIVTFYDIAMNWIKSDKIVSGNFRAVSVDVSKIVANAISVNAAHVVIAHNHLNNQAIPSQEDVNLTTLLRNSLSLLNIKLVDHLIICPNGSFYSFREEGHL